jgi:DNA modification methylase
MTIEQEPLFTDTLPAPDRIRSRVRSGDVWALGDHRLLCGDSTNPAEVHFLLGNGVVENCIADPPYGVQWSGDHGRFSRRTHGEYWRPTYSIKKHYEPVHGDDVAFDPSQLLKYQRLVLWGASNYAASLPAGSWLIWDKRHKSGKAFLADGEMAWMNRGYGVYIYSHVWQGLIRAEPEPALHPTQKPVALMEWCMQRMRAGVTVFDPYAGSGPVLLAAERTKRICFAMEIEPSYCDIIIWRWEQLTKREAVLIASS